MSAENMNEQEQLHAKDNDTPPVELETNTKLLKVDSLSGQCGPSPNDNNVEKVDKAYSTYSCNDSSNNEQKDDDKKVEILSKQNDQLCNDKNSMIQTTVHRSVDKSLKSEPEIILSDEYLSQMLKSNSDREMALYEGAFLISGESDSSQVQLDYADKKDLQPVEKALIIDVSNETTSSKAFDKIELTAQNNDDRPKNLDQKDELTPSSDVLVEKIHRAECMDKNNINQQDLTVDDVALMFKIVTNFDDSKETARESSGSTNRLESTTTNTDEGKCNDRKMSSVESRATEQIDTDSASKQDLSSNEICFNDIKDTENKFNRNIDELESTVAGTNENQFSDGKLPVEIFENVDIKKACTQDVLKPSSISVDVSASIIDNIHNMNWLKPQGLSAMAKSRMQSRRKSSIDSEYLNSIEDVKEDFVEDTKPSTKSAKKRSKSKTQKLKAAEPPKQENAEDKSKKSSNNVGSVNTSKSTNAKAVDKLKDTIDSSQSISIGRGRHDGRKGSLGNSRPRGQNNAGDQRNAIPRAPLDTSTMKDKNLTKDEVKDEKVEDSNENIAALESIKSKESEVHEKEIVSRLHSDTGLSNNQFSSENSANSNKPLTRKNEEKIEKKAQLPSFKDEQESKNKNGTNPSSRPIVGRAAGDSHLEIPLYQGSTSGRSAHENNSEKIPFSKGFGQNTHEATTRNNQSFKIQNFGNEGNWKNHNNQTFSRQENYSARNTSSNNYVEPRQENYSARNTSSNNYAEPRRWNYTQNDTQNMRSYDHTSNRHRNIADDSNTRRSEECFGKNQPFVDKYQGNNGHSDKHHDSTTSGGRYNERNQDYNRKFHQQLEKSVDHRNYNDRSSRNFHQQPEKSLDHRNYNDGSSRNFHQQPEKSQDHRNYNDRSSTKNQECKSYSDIVTDKKKDFRPDVSFDRALDGSRVTSEPHPDKSQDRPYGERFADKLRDNKSLDDRYFAKNQQDKVQDIKTSGDKYSDKIQQSQTSNEKWPDLKNHDDKVQGNKSSGDRYFDKHQQDKVQDSRTSGDRYPDKNQQSKTSNEKWPNVKSHDGSQKDTKKQENLSKNSASFNKHDNPSQSKISYWPQVDSDKYQENQSFNNENPNSSNETVNQSQDHPIHKEKEDCNKVEQNTLNVKSQKHYDNTQQAKVQQESKQIQQSFSAPSVAQNQQLSTTFDQNSELYGNANQPMDFISTQSNQNVDWSSYQNTTELRNTSSPNSSMNLAVNSAMKAENNLQYDQTLYSTSLNQLNNVGNASTEPKSNVAINFEGHQTAQRVTGMDPSIYNQSQISHVNNGDPSRSNTSSPAAAQQTYVNPNVAQLFQTMPPGVNQQAALAYAQSTMNVNAPPFEVISQSNQQSQHQMYTVLSTLAKQRNEESTKRPKYAMQSTLAKQPNQPGSYIQQFHTLMMEQASQGSSNHSISDVPSTVSKSQTELYSAATNLNDGMHPDDILIADTKCGDFIQLHKEIADLKKQLADIQKQLATKESQLLGLQCKALKAVGQVTNKIEQLNSNSHLQEQNQSLLSTSVQGKNVRCPPGFNVSLNVQSSQMSFHEMSNVANLQNYAVEKSASNSVSESQLESQAVYLVPGNMYEQQTANYQLHTDRTANSAAYVQTLPLTAKQMQARDMAMQFPKQ